MAEDTTELKLDSTEAVAEAIAEAAEADDQKGQETALREQLLALKGAEIRALAPDDLKLPSGNAKKPLVEALITHLTAATSEQDGAGGDGAPDPAPPAAEDPGPVEYEEVRKPIEEIDKHGNWTDPFSGLRVYHSTDVCEQSGAQRDGDEAVLLVPKAAS